MGFLLSSHNILLAKEIQEQGYEPEKIVTLLHTIPYKYCKDKPDKDSLKNHIFNVIMYKYKFKMKILFWD